MKIIIVLFDTLANTILKYILVQNTQIPKKQGLLTLSTVINCMPGEDQKHPVLQSKQYQVKTFM